VGCIDCSVSLAPHNHKQPSPASQSFTLGLENCLLLPYLYAFTRAGHLCYQVAMEPLIRETQPPAPLRSRRRNFGNVLLFLRLLSFLVSLATFAILIRYCIAQYKNGAMGGGVLGSVGVRLHLSARLIPRMLTHRSLLSQHSSIGNRSARYGTRGTRSATFLPGQQLLWTQ
jgi:hypothetical protein